MTQQTRGTLDIRIPDRSTEHVLSLSARTCYLISTDISCKIMSILSPYVSLLPSFHFFLLRILIKDTPFLLFFDLQSTLKIPLIFQQKYSNFLIQFLYRNKIYRWWSFSNRLKEDVPFFQNLLYSLSSDQTCLYRDSINLSVTLEGLSSGRSSIIHVSAVLTTPLRQSEFHHNLNTEKPEILGILVIGS